MKGERRKSRQNLKNGEITNEDEEIESKWKCRNEGEGESRTEKNET